MRPILERLVFEERKQRLCRNTTLIASRTSALTDAYIGLKKNLPASDWVFLPKVPKLKDRGDFRSIMYAEDERVVTANDFTVPLQELLSKINRNKLVIESTMCTALVGEGFNTTSDAQLATSVFRPPLNGPVRPFHDILRSAVYEMTPTLHPSTSKKDISLATKLVELAGLDARTATAWDMDQRSTEYVCTREQCSFGRYAIRIFSWRGIVSTTLL